MFLEHLILKTYSDQVSEDLMLYRLSDNDFQIVIEGLGLTEKGTPQAELTEDEFRNRTTFAVDGDTLVLPGGRRYGGEPDEDMSLHDLARGK